MGRSWVGVVGSGVRDFGKCGSVFDCALDMLVANKWVRASVFLGVDSGLRCITC